MAEIEESLTEEMIKKTRGDFIPHSYIGMLPVRGKSNNNRRVTVCQNKQNKDGHSMFRAMYLASG